MRLRSSGERFEVFESLDSTNEEARRRARLGERGPIWLCAERQEAGRGRRGRTWVSETGNLHASILFAPERPAGERPQLSFVAALALHDALVAHLGADKGLRLKWPNDILLDGRKLAGILLEAEGALVIAGFGVNLLHHPADMERPATSVLAARGRRIAAPDLLDSLSASFLLRRNIWRADGFRSIRTDWLLRAEGIGGAVVARLGNGEEREGRWSGIGEDGALLLTAPDGTTEEIKAGDIFPALRET